MLKRNSMDLFVHQLLLLTQIRAHLRTIWLCRDNKITKEKENIKFVGIHCFLSTKKDKAASTHN